MPLLVQCPHCPNQVKVTNGWSRATCPHCCTTFTAVDLRAAEAAAAVNEPRPAAPGTTHAAAAAQSAAAKAVRGSARRAEEDDDDEDSWGNPWSVAAFVVAALGLVSAPVIGVKMLTLGLAGLALLITVVGVSATAGHRNVKDRFWLAFSGVIGALTLIIALTAPGLLNSFWAMDFAVTEADPQYQVVVPRTKPLSDGRPHKADDWADARTEIVRQHEILARVEEAQIAPLPDKGSKDYLLVQIRMANTGRGAVVHFEGFSTDPHKPTLKDKAGRSYPFLEARPRKYNAGGPIEFEPGTLKTGEFKGTMDAQLVFEAPPDNAWPFELILPASAWGRQGECRFKIPEPFKFSFESISQ